MNERMNEGMNGFEMPSFKSVSVCVHGVMPIGDKMHRLVGTHIGHPTNSSLEPHKIQGWIDCPGIF